MPDLIIVSPEGKLHFLEFKSENGSLSDAQEAFQLWAIRASLPHSVVRSVDVAMKVFPKGSNNAKHNSKNNGFDRVVADIVGDRVGKGKAHDWYRGGRIFQRLGLSRLARDVGKDERSLADMFRDKRVPNEDIP